MLCPACLAEITGDRCPSCGVRVQGSVAVPRSTPPFRAKPTPATVLVRLAIGGVAVILIVAFYTVFF